MSDYEADESDDEVEENIESVEIQDTEENVKSVSSSISIIVVDEAERISRNTATISEIAFIIAARAAQISNGCDIFVDTNLYDSVLIALAELNDGKCCLKIERTIYVKEDGSKIVEHWDVNSMAKPSLPQINQLLTSKIN